MDEPAASTTAKIAGTIGAILFLLAALGLLGATALGLLPATLGGVVAPAPPTVQAVAPSASPAPSAIGATPQASITLASTAEALQGAPELMPLRAPEPTLPATPAPEQRAAILAVLTEANAAQTLAYKTGDGEPLRAYYAGTLLEQELAILEQNRQQNVYEERVLRDQQVRSVSSSADGQRAQVEVFEAWDNAFYEAASKRCQSQAQNISLVQTVFLERHEGRWLIFKIVNQAESLVAPEPCG